MRIATAAVSAIVLLASCGGGSPSVNEYAEVLTDMNELYAPQGEALWLEYGQNSAPTVQDVHALMDASVTLRLRIDEALGEVEAPDQIAELHDRWIGWHGQLVADEKALADRAATAASMDEYVQGGEMQRYLDTLQEGKVLCAEIEGTLNSTEAQELFAGTAWMPSDLTEVVHAAIGCDAFPDDIDEIAAVLRP